MDNKLETSTALTPEVVDAATSTETPTQQTDSQDPVEFMSTMFGMTYPRFLAALENPKMSKRAMYRVIRALIGVPLEEVPPNFKNEIEKEAYFLGERLLEAKTVIILDTMYKKQVELEKIKDTPTETGENKENNNG